MKLWIQKQAVFSRPQNTFEATIQGHYGLMDLQNSKQKVQRVFHYLEGLNQRYYLQQTLSSFLVTANTPEKNQQQKVSLHHHQSRQGHNEKSCSSSSTCMNH